MGKTVYAVATGDTYEIVNKYGVHATPATKAYPRATGYIIPIKKGGLCECLYKIVNYFEIKPREIDKLFGKIPDGQFNALTGYHKDRLATFQYDKADKYDVDYRFYILEKVGDIDPFYKKYIQICAKLDMDDLTLIQNGKKNIELHIENIKYQFCSFVHDVDNDTGRVDFCNTKSIVYRNENYKKELIKDAQTVLELNKWSKDWIGSGKIAEKIRGLIDISDNLISWRMKQDLKDKLTPSNKDYHSSIENTFYKLYFEDCDDEVFDELIQYFGAQYRVLAFFFFTKDSDNYLPTSPEIFDEAFSLMNINIKMAHNCSWENYKKYCEIIKAVLQDLKTDKAFADNLCLLDAHSFVWMLTGKDFNDWNNEFKKYNEKIGDEIQSIESSVPEGKDREALVKQRVNQGVFRKRLLKRYKRCCLCNVSNNALLRASHIKPWSVANSVERTDENNGLLLCPNHDALFDEGFISFSDEGNIIISKQLDPVDRIFMNVKDDMKIGIAEENKKYLKYHRDKVLKK